MNFVMSITLDFSNPCVRNGHKAVMMNNKS
jgi:hypothetical protein